ncbi:hypothetical protein B0J17DRAFT_96426 [Rhizoctonia solani]|nr:hypothetical protein B0J17DRAFT_96426 [Rhizoctonia solani]
MLPGSNDSNPISLPGVTAEQFRHYLLAISCRPGDDNYSTFATRYGRGEYQDEWLQHVYTLHVDILTLGRLFGMANLEKWASSMLCSVFMNVNRHKTVTRFASQHWSADALFHLRNLSRNTYLEQPVVTFIQYFISISLRDVTHPSNSTNSLNAHACIDLYDIVKHPGVDPVLLGCIFLNLLSLGHRSRIWSEHVTRRDRAILYAAQVQFIDVTTELQNLGWLSLDSPIMKLVGCSFLCNACETKLTASWRKSFGEIGQGLGSGQQLKDVSLLSQLAKNRWDFYEGWKDICCQACETRGWLRLPSNLIDFLNDNIQTLYEDVASRCGELAE